MIACSIKYIQNNINIYLISVKNAVFKYRSNIGQVDI